MVAVLLFSSLYPWAFLTYIVDVSVLSYCSWSVSFPSSELMQVKFAMSVGCSQALLLFPWPPCARTNFLFLRMSRSILGIWDPATMCVVFFFWVFTFFKCRRCVWRIWQLPCLLGFRIVSAHCVNVQGTMVVNTLSSHVSKGILVQRPCSLCLKHLAASVSVQEFQIFMLLIQFECLLLCIEVCR